MSKRESKLLLSDNLESIDKIKSYTSGYSFEDFLNDSKTCDDVIRNFEIIGEKMGNNFLWKIKMEVELGKKLTEDSRLKDGFKPSFAQIACNPLIGYR